LDALAAAFYDAFTMSGGAAPNIDTLYRIFIPQAIVVNNVGAATEVLDVRAFVEPRRELLSGGAFSAFREWETAETTEIFANIAHRFSRYEKTWVANGRPFSGAGAKSLQFVRTGEGWKLSALAWDDNA
jgi:hypothetical protein